MPPDDLKLATATLDIDRRRRCGFPEVIFGEGKSAATLREIIAALVERSEDVLITRVMPPVAAEIQQTFASARYNELGRTLRVTPTISHSAIRIPHSEIAVRPHVAVITAGTSDLPVAEEARETLDWMGVRVTMIHDVGVAGPHRLPARLAEFESADAIVVVAGMEERAAQRRGRLRGLPGDRRADERGLRGQLRRPLSPALDAQQLRRNVAVVNIDAGFKAAYLAGLIATRCHSNSPTADT